MKHTAATVERLAKAHFGESFIAVRYYADRLSRLAGDTHIIIVDNAPYVYESTSWTGVLTQAGIPT